MTRQRNNPSIWVQLGALRDSIPDQISAYERVCEGGENPATTTDAFMVLSAHLNIIVLSLLHSVMRHPWRFAALVVTVATIGGILEQTIR